MRRSGDVLKVVPPGADEDQMIGEIENVDITWGSCFGAMARCRIGGHGENCKRMRAWKGDKEPPEKVEQVLVKWLVSGLHLDAGARHNGLPHK